MYFYLCGSMMFNLLLVSFLRDDHTCIWLVYDGDVLSRYRENAVIMHSPLFISNNTAILFLFELSLTTFEFMNINYYAEEFRSQCDSSVWDQSL